MKIIKEHGLDRIILERGDRVHVRSDAAEWTIHVEEDDGLMVMAGYGVITVRPQASNVVNIGCAPCVCASVPGRISIRLPFCQTVSRICGSGACSLNDEWRSPRL